MVYHDPRAAHGRAQDLSAFDEIDFAPRGEPSQIEERDYNVVLLWGVEKEYDDGVTWRLKLGITLDDGTMGHWWVGIKQAHADRWNNMLETLDPSLLDPNSDPRPNLKPSEFKGCEFVVRAGYSQKDGSGPWAQAFFPIEGEAPAPWQQPQQRQPQQQYHGYGRPPAGHPAAQRQQPQQQQRGQQQRPAPQGQGQRRAPAQQQGQQRSYGQAPRQQQQQQQQQQPQRQSYGRPAPQQEQPPQQDQGQYDQPADDDLPF